MCVVSEKAKCIRRLDGRRNVLAEHSGGGIRICAGLPVRFVHGTACGRSGGMQVGLGARLFNLFAILRGE
jgi:hypothetical protein